MRGRARYASAVIARCANAGVSHPCMNNTTSHKIGRKASTTGMWMRAALAVWPVWAVRNLRIAAIRNTSASAVPAIPIQVIGVMMSSFLIAISGPECGPVSE
ncbi:hypothetical protein MTsPCn3_22520 [Erythrobacter sp. MTPC3]